MLAKPHFPNKARGPWSRKSSRELTGSVKWRRILVETLEDRRLLSVDPPILVDPQSASDNGLYDNDNPTNVRTAVIEITAAQVGDTIRNYGSSTLLGTASPVTGTFYQYTVTVARLTEGGDTMTAAAAMARTKALIPIGKECGDRGSDARESLAR